ncbi:MAG: DUF1549 and DUF1553 domain-containing protein [Pirellulaceae bacterium]
MQRLPSMSPLTEHLGRTLLAALFAAALFSSNTRADETPTGEDQQADSSASQQQIQRADLRWSADGEGGQPDFTRHVVPLLGKVGCTNRACHGSFQGQGGFRLSLFGHDPSFDYTALTDEGEGPRVIPGMPDESIAVLKPTGVEDHDGGVRFEAGGWQDRLFRTWIERGAKYDRKQAARLERLEVLPSEIVLAAAGGEPVELRVVAHFSDGSIEDATPLTIFSTNDETVAEVTEAGTVSAAGPGDTAIVASYGGGVVTTHVIVPFPGETQQFAYPANNPIDEFVETKLRKVNIAPSELCSDEEFLRRVYLDVIGTLPTADEARTFLADTQPGKRGRLIDELLDRAEYSMYWATKFSDWTGNDNRFTPQPRAKTGWLWHDWLRDKLGRNVPYDEIVGGFLTATTREGRPLDEVVEDYKTIRDNLDKGFDDGTYASRKTNDIFWLKAGNSRAETVGLQVAYAFLSVRLECAQCHKHPFDQWTQDDFKGFTAIFDGLGRGVPKDVPKELAKKGGQQDFRYNEIYVDTSDKAIQRREKQPPKQLAGDVIPFEDGQDPREALWQWMRSPDNRYFARSIANRLWGHYLGVGVVNPVDDFNAANPPSNPQLLDWLAQDFIESGFDLKHLHRRILNSRTYQLSWQPNESNRLDERNFSHALLRRMPAEVVLDAINQVTGGWDDFGSSNAPQGTRAINLAPSRLRGGGPEYALAIFGRPLRTQTCDCERSIETGLAQAMYLLNDEDVNAKIARKDGKLASQVEQIADDRALVEELYLGTLSRYPRDEEMLSSLEFLGQAKDRRQGAEDLLWSLLNLREFVFNH